jgi:hypothetical protein
VTGRRKIVHGDDLLYRFFHETINSDSGEYARLAEQLLTTMAIWLPLDVYSEWPVLLPWVVRDPTCRPSKLSGRPDSWSSPDENGFLRDDNSLIKSLPRALSIQAPRGSGLSGARMGTEFVAAHVWRKVEHPLQLASRLPELNSFVPNVVWLPRQISKLTDREGSVVQRTLQAMSWQVYRDAPVRPALRSLVEESWDLLAEPQLTVQPVNPSTFNWFTPTPAFFRLRHTRLASVLRALDRLDAGLTLEEKVVTSRYTDGLPSVGESARGVLRNRLTPFLQVAA